MVEHEILDALPPRRAPKHHFDKIRAIQEATGLSRRGCWQYLKMAGHDVEKAVNLAKKAERLSGIVAQYEGHIDPVREAIRDAILAKDLDLALDIEEFFHLFSRPKGP